MSFRNFKIESVSCWDSLTRATPRICGKVYDEQPEGVRCRAAHGVWNQALSLAHTTSHSGSMDAPKPRAGPFIATTMGFLKWMNANAKSLKERWAININPEGIIESSSEWKEVFLPYGFSDPTALFLAVRGQTTYQVWRLQAAAENSTHGAEQ